MLKISITFGPIKFNILGKLHTGSVVGSGFLLYISLPFKERASRCKAGSIASLIPSRTIYACLMPKNPKTALLRAKTLVVINSKFLLWSTVKGKNCINSFTLGIEIKIYNAEFIY